MGVIGFDLTVTSDMDVEWQREVMLLNQLGTALLAHSGIKIVHNMRCGRRSTLQCFDSVPKGVFCASGTLGLSNDRLFG